MRATWEYFVEYEIPDLTAEEVNSILASIDWSEWLYVPGLAPVELDFTTSESN